MNFVTTRIGGEHHRIADPDWGDPLDASYAARDGQPIPRGACQPIGQAAFDAG